MKITFDGRAFAHRTFSGVENYTVHIFKALNSKISVECLIPKSNNRYLQQVWEHFKLPLSLSKNTLLFCPSNIAPYWISSQHKLVITLHDVAFKTFPKSVSKPFYYYYSWIIPRNIKYATHIITVSEASKSDIIKYYPEAQNKISVIYNGLDKRYRILPSVNKKKQILYVGSINERKNLLGVITAFEMLPKHLGYNLVIVGNFFNNFFISKSLKRILDDVKYSKHIVFKSKLDDNALIYEYNISSCLVFPSFYEGFGFPILEAMACGTPVICSNSSSLPEVGGDAVVYCNPYDSYDIKEKIELVIDNENLQKEMIFKGLQRVKKFSWEKSANKHMKVFQEVFKG